MSKKFGVLLSGCGVLDGSEIHESVITLLAINKEGHEALCFAPNIDQVQVVNHLTNKPLDVRRNVLVESARIARGDIKDLKEIKASDIDALILPGGFGAALNLSTFGKDGSSAKLLPEVETLIKEIHLQKKPIGAMCIAPNIIAKALGNNVELTIGNDIETASKLEAMGAKHINKPAIDIVIDQTNLVVTTPAYMTAKNLIELEKGINKLIRAVVEMTVSTSARV